jgi:hypothetical protein
MYNTPTNHRNLQETAHAMAHLFTACLHTLHSIDLGFGQQHSILGVTEDYEGGRQESPDLR